MLERFRPLPTASSLEAWTIQPQTDPDFVGQLAASAGDDGFYPPTVDTSVVLGLFFGVMVVVFVAVVCYLWCWMLWWLGARWPLEPWIENDRDLNPDNGISPRGRYAGVLHCHTALA